MTTSGPFWLDAGWRPSGPPIFSRTDAIRAWQRENELEPCFGGARGRRGSDRCAAPGCPFRRECEGLNHRDSLHPARVREDSVELASRAYLNVRAIERRSVEHTPLQAQLAARTLEWSEETPRVAVLGAFSSGKSTLLNRLIGRDLLPATRTPTTAVVTTLRAGEADTAAIALRKTVRVRLVADDARSPDPAVIGALHTWLMDAKGCGVQDVSEEGDDGLVPVKVASLRRELAELLSLMGHPAGGTCGRAVKAKRRGATLRRDVGVRPAIPVERLSRSFIVSFAPAEPLRFDLATPRGRSDLAAQLTRAELALRSLRADVSLCDAGLDELTLVDTAGLCSPVAFHTAVTTDLFERRPDKIVVALDARALDCPTNRVALEVLGRHFVSTPDDYRQVSFALTFCDDALYTRMREGEDLEAPLPWDSEPARRAEAKRWGEHLRSQLKRLLRESTGIPCAVEPMTFMLGLGDRAPHEMVETLSTLRAHLQSSCRNWAGLEMWARRWQAAKDMGDAVEGTRAAALAQANEDLDRIRSNRNVAREQRGIEHRRTAIVDTFAGARETLAKSVTERQSVWLARIRGLDSKSAILKYVEDGFWEDANECLNFVQELCGRQNGQLAELVGRSERLPYISVDRKLLGLDRRVRTAARDEVTGFGYGIASAWDFLFGSVTGEINAPRRKAARAVLETQARGALEIIEQQVKRWTAQMRRVEKSALARLAERVAVASAKGDDARRLAEKLERRSAFLERSEPAVARLRADVVAQADEVAAAADRIRRAREDGFAAVLELRGREVQLRKGRDADVLLVDISPGDEVVALRFHAGARVDRYFPAPHASGRGIHFVSTLKPPWIPGSAVRRLELRVGSLRGTTKGQLEAHAIPPRATWPARSSMATPSSPPRGRRR